MTAGPPVTGTFFNARGVHEPDPLAIGGDERPARRAGEHRHRFEGVERADEELRAAVADIDDAGAVRRDRQVAVVPVDGQRGGTRRRDLQPRDTRRYRFSRARGEPYASAPRRRQPRRAPRHRRARRAATRGRLAAARPMACTAVVERAFQRRARTSLMSPMRCFGILLQAASDVGARARAAASAGSRAPVRLALDHRASTSETSSPSNARVPVSISYSTQPNAQMSAALVDRLAARLLRAHVGGGAEDHARACVMAGRRDRRRLRDDADARRRRLRSPSPGRSPAPSPCRPVAP